MQLIVCLGFSFGKLCKNMEKLLCFRGAMAGLGKYHMGRYGRIGVYRVNCTCKHGNYSILVVFRYMYMASY